ncbi:lysine-specific demethylase JMJ30 isoform X3 [Cryptomeria japonica]|uniref:lysine-specific demethylase JMJ30 isoform X3 n=1 Tax=Cryptomeria japonica TaxID=3369 RepID=UPI0027DA1115|nr:lysine-specific demethylase JMJ30 isoform X3 [Cryptomeria japonica]
MDKPLLMPALDTQRDELLNKVCQEGGFAYVALEMLAATGDVHAAEAAHDMAWEQLHSAPWHSVEPVWRDAYSLSCLHMASLYHRDGKKEEALRILDMGLIMGGPLLRLDLNSAILLLQGGPISTKNDIDEAERVSTAVKENDSGMPAAVESEETFSEEQSTQSFSRQNHDAGSFMPNGDIGLLLKEGAASSTKHGLHKEKRKFTTLDISNEDEWTSQLCKDSQLLKVFKGLPHGSLCSKLIEKIHMLSLEAFLCDFFLLRLPVVISGAMSHWPAMNKWKDMEYLKRVVGDRTVPVEVGRNYLAPGWKQELITISQLLERIQSSEHSSMGPTYLAQHPLFEQISQLGKDICVPDYCSASNGELHSVNAWFGPAGTVTPLHHDPHHNFLAQVEDIASNLEAYLPYFHNSLNFGQLGFGGEHHVLEGFYVIFGICYHQNYVLDLAKFISDFSSEGFGFV